MMVFSPVGGETLTDQKGLSGSDIPPPVPSRTSHTTENLLRDNQVPLNSDLLPAIINIIKRVCNSLLRQN